jgi:hypothetical protein
MILYVNGDSNSIGAEIKDKTHAWPYLLAKQLRLTLVNDAKVGGSNPRILRTVSNFTTHTNTKDMFVVIGWTSWEREEWQQGNVYYDVNAGGHDNLPPDLELKYKIWVTEQNQNARDYKSQVTHEHIHKLHRHYREKNIPHLFFNALMPFCHSGKHLDWHNNFLGPYDNDLSYYWYLKKAGFIPTALNHHTESAQAEWANVLYKHIQENKLL